MDTKKIDLNLRLFCTDCRDPIPNIIEDFAAGDLICGNCGLVLGNRVIDTRSEWRTFANSDDNSGDPSRVGAASDPLLGGSNHLDSTTISAMDKGTGMSKELSRTHNKISHDRGMQNVLDAFKSIQHMGDTIGLPRIVDDEKTLRGKSAEAIKAACLFIACREHKSERTFKEICNLTKVSTKEIGRCYKLIQPTLSKPSQPKTLDAYVRRFCSQLDVNNETTRSALKLCQMVSDRGILAGKSPITLIAACLYFASALSDDPKSAKDIALTAQCTESTLRNAYRKIYEDRYELGKDLGKTSKPISMLPP
ncbi:transcription initiation factor IIB [Boothiomyces macroporosus]|uniref:Transcription initiation factor IIB n=1 Tax=Boothiomyces macroporosus TaxID=261099 RepID=A0AAD5UGJ2_9FUNG|nr:transcription initiation factor IIB [Boothiomyces macroporosus]